jgi:glycosyltransferase involved in cell wall biosynthesis
MIDLGHEVTIYTTDGVDTGWLPYKGKFKKLNDAMSSAHDCMIFANIPEQPFLGVFENCKARVKAFCQMGFPEHMLHTEPTEFLTRKHQYLIDNYWAIADGWWQVEYARKFQPGAGPSIGGINLDMFHPIEREKIYDVVWPGDMRPRKGGEVVKEAIKGKVSMAYFGKGYERDEDGISGFLNKGRVFVDGHRHGGWCNPVIEAMASGVPGVCTKIPKHKHFYNLS